MLFLANSMQRPIRHLGQRLKRFTPLLAAPVALLLSQGQAKAILNVRIFDDGPNLKVTVTGSIASLGNSAAPDAACLTYGFLTGQFDPTDPSILCTGIDQVSPFYSVTGPAGFGGSGYINATSVQGFNFQLYPSSYNTGVNASPAYDPYKGTYTIDTAYVLGQDFFSSATFNGKSLAGEGFTARGLVGTWAINGTSESINVYIGPASVPGPLPCLGVGAAFGWSRRLRKRIATPWITPPQA